MPNQVTLQQSPSTGLLMNEDAVPTLEMSIDAQEQRYRASAYGILAALLRSVPDAQTLKQITAFDQVAVDEDEMLLAMSSLGLAAHAVDSQSIKDEYYKLFIGLGRGELVPYGSWYMTGYLMELPLSALRDDLAKLGIERDASVNEPEDHIASLCEVMLMPINDSTDLSGQAVFFEKHLSPWCERFFQDLQTADSASFYRSVGRFGSAFIALDKQYLTMSA